MKRAWWGFTIVELLVVITVIGILASIVIVSYSGSQDKARQSKIQNDLSQLSDAIRVGRTQQDKTLYDITGNTSTAWPCTQKASGTDLSTLPKTDSCWTTYVATLSAISTASGVNVNGLIDPWGRPYFIDENENESGSGSCTKDVIGVYQRPFVFNSYSPDNSQQIPNSLTACL